MALAPKAPARGQKARRCIEEEEVAYPRFFCFFFLVHRFPVCFQWPTAACCRCSSCSSTPTRSIFPPNPLTPTSFLFLLSRSPCFQWLTPLFILLFFHPFPVFPPVANGCLLPLLELLQPWNKDFPPSHCTPVRSFSGSLSVVCNSSHHTLTRSSCGRLWCCSVVCCVVLFWSCACVCDLFLSIRAHHCPLLSLISVANGCLLPLLELLEHSNQGLPTLILYPCTRVKG